MNPYTSNTYLGLPVVLNDLCSVPNMQPSPEFVRLQSPQLVTETAAWMRKFFGTAEHVHCVRHPLWNTNVFIMSGDSWRRLQKVHNATYTLNEEYKRSLLMASEPNRKKYLYGEWDVQP